MKLTPSQIVTDDSIVLAPGHRIVVQGGGELAFMLTAQTDDDGYFIQLDGVNCRLQGEAPGLYYLSAIRSPVREAGRLADNIRAKAGLFGSIHQAVDLLDALKEGDYAYLREMLHAEADLADACGNATKAAVMRDLADQSEDC